MRRGVVVADGAQHQAGAACGRGTARCRRSSAIETVDEGILAEQDAADERHVGQVTGNGACGAGTILLPTKPAPIRPESPTPRIVSARPVATWLAARPSVRTPKTPPAPAPARMPQSAPTRVEPRDVGAGEAAGGADDHHALDAEIEHAGALDDQFAGRREQQRRRGGDHRQEDGFKQQHARAFGTERDEADAVEDERVAGEHEEQQDALEHLGEIERHLHRDLRALAADEGQRQEQAGEQDADGLSRPRKATMMAVKP